MTFRNSLIKQWIHKIKCSKVYITRLYETWWTSDSVFLRCQKSKIAIFTEELCKCSAYIYTDSFDSFNLGNGIPNQHQLKIIQWTWKVGVSVFKLSLVFLLHYSKGWPPLMCLRFNFKHVYLKNNDEIKNLILATLVYNILYSLLHIWYPFLCINWIQMYSKECGKLCLDRKSVV